MPEGGLNLDEALAKTELTYIEEALRLTEGKKTEAWKILGLNDRFALRRRVKSIAESHGYLLALFPLVRERYND